MATLSSVDAIDQLASERVAQQLFQPAEVHAIEHDPELAAVVQPRAQRAEDRDIVRKPIVPQDDLVQPVEDLAQRRQVAVADQGQSALITACGAHGDHGLVSVVHVIRLQLVFFQKRAGHRFVLVHAQQHRVLDLFIIAPQHDFGARAIVDQHPRAGDRYLAGRQARQLDRHPRPANGMRRNPYPAGKLHSRDPAKNRTPPTRSPAGLAD